MDKKLTIQEQLELMRSGQPYDAHTPEDCLAAGVPAGVIRRLNRK